MRRKKESRAHRRTHSQNLGLLEKILVEREIAYLYCSLEQSGRHTSRIAHRFLRVSANAPGTAATDSGLRIRSVTTFTNS